MKILIKTVNKKYDVRGTYTHDFYKELQRQSGAHLSYERDDGDYDVCIGGKGKVSVKIQTDIHRTKKHKTPQEIAAALNNKGWDIILMRYTHMNYDGIPATFYQDSLSARVVFFPWSFCPKRWSCSEQKDNDVVLLGSTKESMYPIRAAIRKSLPLPYKTISGNVSMAIKRDKAALKKMYNNIYVGKKYIQALQRSKVMLTDASKYGCPVKKYFEAMATGCLLMADRPNHAENIGLIDGETYVEISKDNWREKLDYYLANDTERLRITRNARELFEAKHTNEVRVKQLLKLL